MHMAEPAAVRTVQADIRAIMDALRQIVRALRVSSRAAEARLGISGAQLFVLQRLAEQRALAINALADRTFTHQSSVSVVVKRLAERGLLVRRPAADDGRRREIALTAAGRALVRRVPQTAQMQITAALRRLPAAQRRALAGSLTLLARELGPAPRVPELFFEERPARRRPPQRSHV
jgi:DNA-binding MarR family transcriptional regulator